MKDDKEIEQILLNDKKFNDLMNSRTEQEFHKMLEDENSKKEIVITDIKKVPKNLLFSKKAIYEVINKDSKTCSYINGLQAEALLGSNDILRTKLLSYETDNFVSGSCYIKFVKVKY